MAENIFANISNNYYRLTTSEKKVADYILSNKTQVQFMSISELAEESGVAEATVSRFCRRLNLRGYNAFRLALAKATAGGSQDAYMAEGLEGEISESDTLADLCCKLYAAHTAALSQTKNLVRPEQIAQAVSLMADAERVYCMGQGGSMIIAEEAWHLFSTISPHFFAVADSHLQASAAALTGPRDVLLIFSYSGSTKDLVDLMGLARDNGAKVILITRFAKSPGSASADVVLQCGSNEGPLQLGSVSARMAQLYLIDVLFNELFRRNTKEAHRCQERIANALVDKHL